MIFPSISRLQSLGRRKTSAVKPQLHWVTDSSNHWVPRMGPAHTKHILNHCPTATKNDNETTTYRDLLYFFFVCVLVCVSGIYLLKGTYNSQLHWIYLISKAPSGGISKIFRASKTSCGAKRGGNVRNLGPCQKYGFHSRPSSAPYAEKSLYCNLGMPKHRAS